MASIRNLKKDINFLAYELLTEVFAYKHFHPETDEKKLDEMILDLVKIRNELIARTNSAKEFDNPSQVKSHFSKIQSDMVKLVDVMDRLSK